METIKNAIWGSGNNNNAEEQSAQTPAHEKEPISGETGDVSKGEPYDAGNMTPQVEQPENPLATNDAASESTQPTKGMHSGPAAAEQTDPAGKTAGEMADSEPKKDDVPVEERQVDVTGPGPRPIADIAKENGGHMPEKRETAMMRGISMESTSSKSSSSSSSSDDDDDEEADEPATKRNRESLTSHEAEDEGPARDQRKKSLVAAGTEGTPADKIDDHDGMHQDGSHPATDDYISSGMKSDGGNFDVTKPGAGKEAQRLMHQGALTHREDEEGKKAKTHSMHLPIHKKNSGESGGNNSLDKQQQRQEGKADDASTSSKGGGEGKAKLSQRIKDKLHIGSKE